MYIAEFSALAAALCWSFGGLLSTVPARALGAIRFNRLRQLIVAAILGAVATVIGGWGTLNAPNSLILVVSAMIGIVFGDTLLYAALKRLGPRRTGILFTTNAPIAVIIGYLFLQESLPPATITGCVLIMTGVLLAVFFGTRASQKHTFETIQGSLPAGLLFGFLSATCQAVSVIIARPVMAAGVDVVAASALRVATAAVALTIFCLFRRERQAEPPVTLTVRLVLQTGASGVVGMALGMTFLLLALAHGPAGLVATLSATSPILILPVLWVATRERPASGAWLGAALAVFGVACIFHPWSLG